MLPAELLPLATPALPLDEAGKYVAGAYVVFLVLIVVYVGIMAAKLQRIERELGELASFAEQGKAGTPGRSRAEPGSPVAGAPSEDVPVDPSQSATVSDRNLTLSEAGAGQPDHDQGSPDV
jgi:hypothetical protein